MVTRIKLSLPTGCLTGNLAMQAARTVKLPP